MMIVLIMIVLHDDTVDDSVDDDSVA